MSRHTDSEAFWKAFLMQGTVGISPPKAKSKNAKELLEDMEYSLITLLQELPLYVREGIHIKSCLNQVYTRINELRKLLGIKEELLPSPPPESSILIDFLISDLRASAPARTDPGVGSGAEPKDDSASADISSRPTVKSGGQTVKFDTATFRGGGLIQDMLNQEFNEDDEDDYDDSPPPLVSDDDVPVEYVDSFHESFTNEESTSSICRRRYPIASDDLEKVD